MVLLRCDLDFLSGFGSVCVFLFFWGWGWGGCLFLKFGLVCVCVFSPLCFFSSLYDVCDCFFLLFLRLGGGGCLFLLLLLLLLLLDKRFLWSPPF